MPTKLPKISAYIPLDLYECLQKDKQKTEMSMSQVIASLKVKSQKSKVKSLFLFDF